MITSPRGQTLDAAAELLRIDAGRPQLPSAPGLGVRLDETTIARYRLAPGPVPDGNYSDMLFGTRPPAPVPYTAPWPGPAPLAAAAG